MHWSQRRLCRKIGKSLSFPKMYYSMPINMFIIVKNHWEPSFTDNPRRNAYIWTISCFSYKKGDEANCSNYCGISLLSTSYKIVFYTLPLRLSIHIWMILLERMSVGYDKTDKLLTIQNAQTTQ
jgi:hypothetical protein